MLTALLTSLLLSQLDVDGTRGPWAPETERPVDLPAPAVESEIIAEALAAPSEPEWLDAFRARLDQAAREDKVVGLAAAVIENGRTVLVYTHGETAAGSGEPVTRETVFRAASLTKSFTGTLLAVLEHEGLVDLDATVPSDVITLKSGGRPTWLQLVSHQTGLPPNAYDNLIEAGRDPVHARARLAEVDPICALGECYTYQNIAFGASQVLIEQATGMSYEQEVRRWLFEPYGLDTASLGADALRAADSWARPHRGWRRAFDRPGSPDTHYDGLPAAAGINLTLDDLIAWARAHLAEHGGVPREARERAWTPYINSLRETVGLREVRARVDETAYGIGWRIYKWGDRTLIMHSGYLSGYGAQIVMEPATGFAFVALWNADARAPWRLWPTVMDLRTGAGPGDWLDRLKG